MRACPRCLACCCRLPVCGLCAHNVPFSCGFTAGSCVVADLHHQQANVGLAWVSVPGSWRQQHRRLLLLLCVLFAVVWSSLVDKRLGGGSTLACCCWSPLSPLACCGQRRSAAVYHHRARAVCPLLLLLPLPGLSPVDCVALKHGPGRSARYIPTALLLPRTSANCVTPPGDQHLRAEALLLHMLTRRI